MVLILEWPLPMSNRNNLSLVIRNPNRTVGSVPDLVSLLCVIDVDFFCLQGGASDENWTDRSEDPSK